MSSGVSGSGSNSNSGGVSSSFTSSAGMTSGSFEDDEEDTDDSSTSSSDYEDAQGGGATTTTTVVDTDAAKRADVGDVYRYRFGHLLISSHLLYTLFRAPSTFCAVFALFCIVGVGRGKASVCCCLLSPIFFFQRSMFLQQKACITG